MCAPTWMHFSQPHIDSRLINSEAKIGIRLQGPGVGKKSEDSYYDNGHRVYIEVLCFVSCIFLNEEESGVVADISCIFLSSVRGQRPVSICITMPS